MDRRDRRRRSRAARALVTATLLAAAAAAAGPVRAGEPGGRAVVTVEAERRVTVAPSPVRLYDVPALAVHPRDPATVVVAVGDARNGGCGIWASRDAGLSWAPSASMLPASHSHCAQLVLGPVMAPAFGADGTLHVAMPASSPETGHPRGPIDLVVANTADLGASHATVTVAKAASTSVDPAAYGGRGQAQEGNEWHKFPSLAVDPRDPQRLYLAWRWTVWGKDLQSLSGDVPFRPYFATSEDGGRTWSTPVDILAADRGEEVFGSSVPMLTVGRDGTIYGFSKELPMPAPAGQPRPAQRLLLYRSTDQGQTWETSVFHGGGENIRDPQPAIDPRTGNLYVVFGLGGAHTPVDQPAPAPQKLHVMTSTDGGRTWSDPVKLDDPRAPTDRGDQFHAGISVAPNGRVDVAWYDFRNDPFGPRQTGRFFRGERYWDVYYSYSTDAGATWSPNIRVTASSVDGGIGATFNNIDTRGPMAIASTDDLAYVAWPDSRASGPGSDAEDVYLSRLRFGETVPAADRDEGRWPWVVLGAGLALGAGGLLLLGGVRGGRTSPR